jgi:hypothetical protein
MQPPPPPAAAVPASAEALLQALRELTSKQEGIEQRLDAMEKRKGLWATLKDLWQGVER